MIDSRTGYITAAELDMLTQLSPEQLRVVAAWLKAEGFARFEDCYSYKFIDALNYVAARLETLADEQSI